MSEMAAFLRARGKFPLSLIHNPAKTWSFVGAVPVDLAWVYDDIQDVKDAAQFGAGLVRKRAHREGRRFATRTWPTREAALAEAAALGHQVAGQGG